MAILEPEREYASLFLDYIREKKDFLFDTKVFTEQETLLAFMEKNKINILLASKKSDYKEAAKKAEFTILLSEEQYVGEVSHPVVYKFQSAEHIIKEVYDIYLVHHGGTELRYVPKEQSNKKKYVIFSPYGGVGKSIAAMTMGSILAEKKNVLVVNMEPFSKKYFWQEQHKEVENHGVSNIMYYMNQSHCDIEMKIKSMVYSVGNVDYLAGVSNLWDLQLMQEEEMYQLLKVLDHYTSYDVIIFDVSFMSKGIKVLFEECTGLIIPCLRELQMEKEWTKAFCKNEQEMIERKGKYILLPYVENMDELRDIQYLAQGDYGKEIRKILEGDIT